MAQGFVISENLIESTPESSDSSAINNLAGDNTANTFKLFDGNTKFISRLYRYEFNVINPTSTGIELPSMSQEDKNAVNNKNTVQITAEGRTAFSNGTKIALVTAADAADTISYDHVVFNSNGVDKFQVRLGSDTRDIPDKVDVSGFDYIQRKDNVTFDNLNFYSIKSLETDPVTASGSSSGYSDSETSGGVYGNATLTERLTGINDSISALPFKKTRLIIGYEPTTFTENISFEGGISSVNSAGSAVTTTGGNGIFIKGSGSETAQRINSATATVPFSNATGKIESASGIVKVEVDDLEINPGDKLSTEATSTVLDIDAATAANLFAADTTNTMSDFTHKMPITINDEEYFLLMVQET